MRIVCFFVLLLTPLLLPRVAPAQSQFSQQSTADLQLQFDSIQQQSWTSEHPAALHHLMNLERPIFAELTDRNREALQANTARFEALQKDMQIRAFNARAIAAWYTRNCLHRSLHRAWQYPPGCGR